MKVILLHDALGAAASVDELDVYAQMDAIGAALEELGHSWERLAFTLDLESATAHLRDSAADVVFNLVESVNGHGRLVHLAPALLESLRIPFTGCSADATYTSANKVLAKVLMRAAGIPTPEWFAPTALQRGAEVSPGRWIIKSVWEHASRGLDESSVVEVSGARELLEAIDRRRDALGGDGFAERYIQGREFNLSMLDGEVLPPAEIVFEGYGNGVKVVGYKAKWDASSPEYHSTPRRFAMDGRDSSLLENLELQARSSWDCFGLSGYARVDFRVDEHGRPWVLEVNSNPCLSSDAGFAAAVEQKPMSYSEAIKRVLAAAVRGREAQP